MEDKDNKIKKVIIWLAVAFVAISMSGCVLYFVALKISDKPCFKEGITENTVLMQWDPSQYFTDDEIRSAAEAAKEYFKEHRKNSELLSMSYAGDDDMDVREVGDIVFHMKFRIMNAVFSERSLKAIKTRTGKWE